MAKGESPQTKKTAAGKKPRTQKETSGPPSKRTFVGVGSVSPHGGGGCRLCHYMLTLKAAS